MKLQTVKRFCAVSITIFALLSYWVVIRSNAVAAPPTAQHSVLPSSILSLPYHGVTSAPPLSASLSFEESGIYVAQMLCSDELNNIYVYDRVSEKQCAVKKFDAQGQLLQIWLVDLHGLGDGVSATVLSDGKVWFNLGVGALANEKSGLPLVILQPGHDKPVAEWHKSLPEAITKLLYSSVTSETWQGMPTEMKAETRTWVITRLSNGDDHVLFDATNIGGGATGYSPEANVTKSQKLMWRLSISGDGKKVIQARSMAQKEIDTPSSFQPLKGVLWHSESDSASRPRNWTKLWLWKDGQAKGDPLVTRAELQQPIQSWQKLVGTQTQSPPHVSVDAKGNIYLSWRRKSKEPTRRFTVGENSWLREPMGEDYGQKALVVLDSNRNFVTSVPWTTCYYEWDDWIIPAPDGSGFYRQEFGEKSLNIYWYALPNFEAPANAQTKAQPLKR